MVKVAYVFASPFLWALAARGRELMLFPIFSNHSIMRAELDGSNPTVLVSGQPHVNFCDAVVVDAKNNKMYWTNMGTAGATKPRAGSVYKANLDGSGIEAVVPPGTIGAGKQAHLDTERQQLYVGDKQSETAGIWRVDLATGAVYHLLEHLMPSASGVTLDHTGERVLFTSDGEGHPSGVGSMAREIPPGMTASNRTDVTWHYTSENPIDVITDSRGRVYWTDGGGISSFGVRVGSVDGAAPARTIRTKKELNTSFPVGVSLSKDEQTVYYVAFGMAMFGQRDRPGAIYKSSVHGGGKQELVYEAGYGQSMTGLSIVDLPDTLLV